MTACRRAWLHGCVQVADVERSRLAPLPRMCLANAAPGQSRPDRPSSRFPRSAASYRGTAPPENGAPRLYARVAAPRSSPSPTDARAQAQVRPSARAQGATRYARGNGRPEELEGRTACRWRSSTRLHREQENQAGPQVPPTADEPMQSAYPRAMVRQEQVCDHRKLSRHLRNAGAKSRQANACSASHSILRLSALNRAPQWHRRMCNRDSRQEIRNAARYYLTAAISASVSARRRVPIRSQSGAPGSSNGTSLRVMAPRGNGRGTIPNFSHSR